MNKTISWKWLIGLGIVIAAGLFLTGSGGTLATVLYGLAALLVILGVLQLVQK